MIPTSKTNIRKPGDAFNCPILFSAFWRDADLLIQIRKIPFSPYTYEEDILKKEQYLIFTSRIKQVLLAFCCLFLFAVPLFASAEEPEETVEEEAEEEIISGFLK